MVEWIKQNYTWLFDGIGSTTVIIFLGFIGRKIFGKKDDKGKFLNDSTIIKSGRCRKDIFQRVKMLLTENKQLLIQYGPNSVLANNNPLSDAVKIWKQNKVNTIIPNNNEIIELFENNSKEFTDFEIRCFNKFKIHARAFEFNQEKRLEINAVPCFPKEFEKMILEEKYYD